MDIQTQTTTSMKISKKLKTFSKQAALTSIGMLSIAAAGQAITAMAVPATSPDQQLPVSCTQPTTLDVLSNDAGLPDSQDGYASFELTIPMTPLYGSTQVVGTTLEDAAIVYTVLDPSLSPADLFQYQVLMVHATNPALNIEATEFVDVSVDCSAEQTFDNTTGAVADTANAVCQTPIIIDVLANDIINNTPGYYDAQVLSIDAQPTMGSAVVNGSSVQDFSITYTPNADANGTDTFSYDISLGKGQITLTVGTDVNVDVTCPTAAVEDPIEEPVTDPVEGELDEQLDEADVTEEQEPFIVTNVDNSNVTIEETATGNTTSLEVNQECNAIQNVSAVEEADIIVDEENQLVNKVISFELACDTAEITVYWEGVNPESEYQLRKFGPTTPGDVTTTQWYNFPSTNEFVEIEGQQVLKTTYTLTDGQLGDDTGIDGVIIDPVTIVELLQEEQEEVIQQPVNQTPVSSNTQTAVAQTGGSDLVRSGGSSQAGLYFAVFSLFAIASTTISLYSKKA